MLVSMAVGIELPAPARVPGIPKRRRGRRARAWGLPLAPFLLAPLVLGAGGEAPAERPGPPVPDLVGRLGPPGDLGVPVISGNATAAAVVLRRRPDPKGRRSTVRIARRGEPGNAELELGGSIRALAFDKTADTLFLIAHTPRKRGPGEASLVRVDMDALRARRVLRLAPDARALAVSGDGALLVAGAEEVRTFVLPSLRSGRLFPVPGPVSALAAIPDGFRLLLGGPEGLALVDLEDPAAGREALPIRERLATPSPVIAIELGEGGSGLARLRDGSRFRFRLDPLRPAAADDSVPGA